MVSFIGPENLLKCAAVLGGIPTVAWLGLCVVAIGGLVYWALDCYFVEAILGRYPIEVVSGVESAVTNFAKEQCGSLKRRYRSTPWLCSPHLQTLFLHFDPWSPAVKYRREVFPLPDGGSIGLDWCGTEQPTTPTVVIIPGLTSDSSNAYLRYLVADITKQGWRAVVVNHRGLGGVSLTSETFYNAGWTQDMREVLSAIKSRLPNAPLALAGCSLGANMVIKYLGEEGPESFLWGAVAMGCPFDLLVCDRFMNRNFVQRLWNSALAHGMREFAELHKEPFSKVTDFVTLQRSRTLREFDDRITRFTANYETVDTYYRRCSSAPYMTSVRTPLLALSALDDPICTKESIPWDECRLNPYVILATAPRGGHLAIYAGWLPRRLWWTKPCVEFLAGVFEKGFKGLEPVGSAANGVAPRVGLLPLVHGVGEDTRVGNGLPERACNGETLEAVAENEATPLRPMAGTKLAVADVGVEEMPPDERMPSQRPKPNGFHVSDHEQVNPYALHAKANGVYSHLNGEHSHMNGVRSQPNGVQSQPNGGHFKPNGLPAKANGICSHLNGVHSQPNGIHVSNDDVIRATGPFIGTCLDPPVKPTVNIVLSPVKPAWAKPTGKPEWPERNGTDYNGSPNRVVIEFSDEGQVAAVEAFLSEVLEQMRGVASTPRPVNQSLKDAALIASSAAASASAVAAAAAAVVRSASAAALTVRSPSATTPTVQSSSAAALAKPLGAADLETRATYENSNYSELVKCYESLARSRENGTWLLAYVAVAVSFPLVGAVWRMRASQKLKGSAKLARKLSVG